MSYPVMGEIPWLLGADHVTRDEPWPDVALMTVGDPGTATVEGAGAVGSSSGTSCGRMDVPAGSLLELVKGWTAAATGLCEGEVVGVVVGDLFLVAPVLSLAF